MAVRTANEYVINITVGDKFNGPLISMQKTALKLKNIFSKLGASIVVLNQGFELLSRIQMQVSRAMGATFGRAVELEKSVAEITTLLDDSTEAQSFFTKEVLNLQAQFGGNQTDIAKAYYQALSSGAVDASTSTQLLIAANKLAIGGITSLSTSVDGLTTILNAYGLSIDKATDVSDALFLGMKAGKTTISELSSSLGQAAALASATGVSFQELIGSVSAITTGGVDTAQAVTQVRSVMVGLSKQTSDLQTILKKLNITSIQSAVEQQGLVNTLKQIIKETDGSTESLTKLFGRIEAVNAVLALTSDDIGGKFNDIMVDMGKASENTGEVTSKSFEKMAATADFRLNRMKAQAEVAFTKIGNIIKTFMLPIIESLTNAIVEVSDRMIAFHNAIKQVDFKSIANGITSFTIALTSLSLVLKGGAIVSFISNMKTILPLLKGIAVAFGTFAQSALFVGSVIIGIGGAIDLVIRNLDPLLIKLEQIFLNKIPYFFQYMATEIIGFGKTISDVFSNLGIIGDEAINRINNRFIENKNKLAEMGSEIDILENKYKSAINNIDFGIFGAAFKEGKKFLDSYNNSLDETRKKTESVSKATGSIQNIEAAQAIETPSPKVIGQITPLFDEQTIANMGTAFSETLGSAASNAATTMAGGMSAMASGPLAVAQAANMILDAIKQIIDLIPQILNKIADVFNMIVDLPMKIADGVFSIIDSIGNVFENLIPNIINAGLKLMEAGTKLPETIFKAIENLFKKLPEMGSKIGETVGKSLAQAPQWIALIIKMIPRIIKEFIKGIPKFVTAFVDALILVLKQAINDLVKAFGGSDIFNIDLGQAEEQIKDIGENIQRSSTQLFEVVEMQARARGTDLADRIRNAIGSSSLKTENMLQKMWNKLVEVWRHIWNSFITPLAEFLKSAFSSLWEGFKALVIALYEMGKAVWDLLIKALQKAWDNIIIAVQTLWTKVSELWSSIVDIASKILEGLKATLKTIVESISSLITSIQSLIKNLAKAIADFGQAIIDFGSNILEKAKEIGKAIWNTFSDLVDKGADKFKEYGTKIWDSFVSIFKEQLPNLLKDFSNVGKKIWYGFIDKFIEGFKNLVTDFTNIGKNIWDGFVNKFVDGFKNLVTDFANLGKKIWDGFKSVFDLGSLGLGGGGGGGGISIGGTTGEILSSVGLSKGGEVKYFQHGGEVQYFQSGGFTSKGTDTIPAMLTPGEFVINRESANANKDLLKSINQNKTPLGVNQNQVINITINAKTLLDPAQIKKEIIPEIEKALKRKSQEGRFVLSNAGLRA